MLETHGINVWCAAGKGTFSSSKLIRQVKEANGFFVKFGPVFAGDIQAYLSAGYRKDQRARSVSFAPRDRIILTAAELANSLRYLFLAYVFILLLSGIHSGGYSLQLMRKEGLQAGLYLLAAYMSEVFLAPLLLPLLPFRQSGGKGILAGMLVFGLLMLISNTYVPLLALEVCPHNVFRMAGKIVELVSRDKCMECGACELNCETGALKVKQGVGCASAVIYGFLRGTEATCDCGSDDSCC